MICNLADPLALRIENQVDLLFCNPPYVPTDPAEYTNAVSEVGIETSWAGGTDGMTMIQGLIPLAKVRATAWPVDNIDISQKILSNNGLFYLVAVKQNNIACILRICEGVQLTCQACCGEYASIMNAQCLQVVLDRRAGREHLFVLRICRRSMQAAAQPVST